MIKRLTGGTVYDPAHGIDGQVLDIYMEDGCIVAEPNDKSKCETIDVQGCILMAGAIDIHTHIGGGKATIARAMMQEGLACDAMVAGDAYADGSNRILSTLATGYRYAEMGYVACFEPAMLPVNARQAHIEMADTPLVDTGGYIMVADDIIMDLISAGAEPQTIQDYIAWNLCAAQAIGIKIVNPGGIHAFKFNQRSLDLDETAPHYNITPRQIIGEVCAAIDGLGVPHPLHIHTSNLGVPGNYRSTLATMQAAEGHRIHLTHIQFHSYGDEGDRRFSSAAAQIAESINRMPNVSADVGQIMFGQTVTASADTQLQFRHCKNASPKKSTIVDIECEAGCGVVPFKYRDQNFVHALQWLIGLELFLMVEDPWRILLTTDHPNGAPFTSYPHLIRLLMDKTFRNSQMERLHHEAVAASVLPSLDRQYSLYEIAISTRAAPARLLGLHSKGHLGVGADADVVVYESHVDVESMFSRPRYVFKSGELIVRDGRVLTLPPSRTHTIRPEYDTSIEKKLKQHYQDYRGMRFSAIAISDDEMAEQIGSEVKIHPCQSA